MPALIVLAYPSDRQKAHRWIDAAPVNARISFAGPKRTLDQNSALWRLLTLVADQHRYHGQKLTPDDYRLVFLDALKREVRRVPALDDRGWVDLGRSSSKLSKEEFSDLLELVTAWCAQNGIDIDGAEAPEATASGAGAAA